MIRLDTEHETHIVAGVKKNEKYIVLYEQRHAAHAIRTISRWAANPELSLDWHGAAAMARKVKADR